MSITAIAYLICLLSSQKQAPTVGPVMLRAKGPLSYSRAGHKPVRVSTLYIARVGDVVSVGPNAEATFTVKANGRLYTLLSGDKVKITKTAAVLLSGPALNYTTIPQNEADATHDDRIALFTQSRGGGGSLEPEGAYREGPIKFHWEFDASATNYKLRLTQIHGELIKEFTIDSNAVEFTVPSGVMKEGEWVKARLIPTTEQIIGSSKSECIVKVLSLHERERLALGERKLEEQKKKLGAEYDWAKAEMLASYGLVDEMKEAWKAGLKPLHLREDTTSAQWMLGEWYEVAGFTGPALRAYQAAETHAGNDRDLEDAINRLSSASN